MLFRIEPEIPDFVARVTHLDVRDLDPASAKQIVAASNEYPVLLFPGQHLSKQELVTFGELFGALDGMKSKTIKNAMGQRLDSPYVHDISNLDDKGEVATRGAKAIFNVGNSAWHSDGSFQHVPARYSILSCIQAVSWGGQTEFADLRKAYDRLDERTKALIADKVAIFWSGTTRQALGIYDDRDMLANYPPVRWPMVRTHPGSGRKLLWCDRKVMHIEGMSVPEGRALADELIEHTTLRDNVYAHIWTPGDLLLVDNRACLHRGRRADSSEPREMIRVQVADESCSLGAIELEQVRPDIIYGEDLVEGGRLRRA